MNQPAFQRLLRIRSFRTKLLLSMLVVVFGVSAIALYFAEASATANIEENLQHQFQHELNALHQLQEARYADLIDRCEALSWRSRIHAALEDNAVDLLYPSAEGELHDLLDIPDHKGAARHGLRAEFYRFLGRDGRVITPPNATTAGELSRTEEAKLAVSHLPSHQEIGYLEVSRQGENHLLEVIAMPIVSTETGEVIADIVIGFQPMDFANPLQTSSIQSATWTNGHLYNQGRAQDGENTMSQKISDAIRSDEEQGRFTLTLNNDFYFIEYYRLNPASLFPAAYEVFTYPLRELADRRAQIRWQIIGGSVLLLLLGFVASHTLAERLSAPVEKLQISSAENLLQRERAEAALNSTRTELQRSARFSADASHQLKTPVSVLRAGLEEWLARPNLTAEDVHELAAMVHQTYRLASVIEDLLLLSRIDAGHLQLELVSVNLNELIDGWLDDLSTLPNPWNLKVENEIPPALNILGEKRYTTMILQNLLENARKYNRPQGRIRIAGRRENETVFLSVANTGRPIPKETQEHIFERFHRGDIGENVPGHGLGLNLARELARNHRGELTLVRSDHLWTEFEVRFLAAADSAKS